AFRISKNKIIHQIVTEFNKPIVSTSANLTGSPALYSINDVKSNLKLELLDFIIDSGQLPINKPSTIVDFQLLPSPQITRVGDITVNMILETLGIRKELWSEHMRLLEK
ncbi:MAG: hypothetical protein FK731_14995, partial [Asgard group archaeon]|nr:hypothetical protein [Asgard group archaeon]